MSMMIQDIQPHWTAVRPYLSIRREADYDRAVEQMNELIDIVGTQEDHPMYEFLDTLGTLIHAYEEEHYLMPSVICQISEKHASLPKWSGHLLGPLNR